MRWFLFGHLFLVTGLLPAQQDVRVHSARLTSRAEMLMAEGHAAEAADHYRRAFALYPWDGFNYYSATKAALAAGDTTGANAFLSAGVRHGFDEAVITGDAEFMSFLASPASRPFHDRREQDQADWALVADSTLIKVLDSLSMEDQRCRQGPATDLRAMQRIDSLNFEHLIHRCERSGFPDPRTLGHALGDLLLLLWHHRAHYPEADQWQRMMPYIQQAIMTGTVAPTFLCRFDDFASWRHGEPMRWGVLVGFFAQDPAELFLADPETMDRDRSSVGLAPIHEALRLAGLNPAQVRFANK